jgi:hypothetical protein
MSISEFLNGREKEPFSAKVERHFKKYGTVYKVAGMTLIILTSGLGSHAFASNGVIDRAGRTLYIQLVNIGKWVIIFKGGVDIIKALGSGDIDHAKKAFFGYLLTYLFLLGLPFGMDKVDEIYTQVSTGK